MSYYANYIKEKTNDLVLEVDYGFATYRYLDEKTVYITDIYIHPDFRRKDYASNLADIIVEEAKQKGCTKLMGSVIPSNKNSTDSLRVLLGYKMSLESSVNDFIIFKKEI
jgi:ribosomal protein S18 acetylase RimI-like enzyme